MSKASELEINKIAKLEGMPEERVVCECGTECKQDRNIYENGKHFTTWFCPKCVKVTYG